MFNACTRREIEALIDGAIWVSLKSSTSGFSDRATEVLGVYLVIRGSLDSIVSIYEEMKTPGLNSRIGFAQQMVDGNRHFLNDRAGCSLIYKAAVADRRRRREALVLNGACAKAAKTTTRRL